MNYEFSKLEMLWEKVKINQYGEVYDIRSFFTGGGIIKIFKRKWYNPLRYILAKHGIKNTKKEKFFIDPDSNLL